MYEDVKLGKMEGLLREIVQHYNHGKYWKYRSKVVDPHQGTKVGDTLRLLYIKKADAYNNASMGTHRNFGATFLTPPILPHGLNGIIVSHNAVIGERCRIFHQVTIGEGRGGAPIIGNDVLIGAGAKIIGNVKIGNRVKIAAGCVIMQDIADDVIVLPGENKLIYKGKGGISE